MGLFGASKKKIQLKADIENLKEELSLKEKLINKLNEDLKDSRSKIDFQNNLISQLNDNITLHLRSIMDKYQIKKSLQPNIIVNSKLF